MCFFRGGNWNNGANAGVFYLNGNNTRGNSSDNIGFRAAYPGNPLVYSLRAATRDQVKGYVSGP